MIRSVNSLPHYMAYDALVFLAQELTAQDAGRHILVSLDFDNFNYVNDLFGYEAGDKVLRRFSEHLSANLNKGEYFCHLHADQFILWLHDAEADAVGARVVQFTNLQDVLEDILPDHYNLVCSVGIVGTVAEEEAFSVLLDKANFARKRAKGSYSGAFLYFDSEMASDMQWRKTLTLMMDSALRNNEFQMYLQPKIIIKSGEIAGAEALVRWNSPVYGLISPDRFIPIMECNGFIRQLDFFMLEEACRYIKACKEEKRAVLPVAVNFSKVHIRDANFVEQVFQVVNRYAVHTSLIEIEFTENMFTADFQALVDVATSLKLLGFRVALDDFGSAYSSLNCLKDLPLDVIKIDKSFLDDTTDSDRGRIIVAKIVELIKSLRLISVMEGIEDLEQVEFLKKLSCDMGQGYHYAKPMPAEDYTEFVRRGTPVEEYTHTLEGSEDTSDLYIIPQEFQLDNWELYTLGKNIDIGLMKGRLDGEATVQYVNDRALEYLGYSRQEFREIFDNRISAFAHPDDVHMVRNHAEQLAATGKPIKFQTRAIRKDGKIIILQGRASCVVDNRGRPVGIYAFQDVTEELEREANYHSSIEEKVHELEKAVEDLHVSRERYRVLLEQSNEIVFEWDFIEDSIAFSNKYRAVFGMAPICDCPSTNPAIRKNVHPEDLEPFEEWMKSLRHMSAGARGTFRLRAADGSYIRLQARSTAVCDTQGRPLRGIGVLGVLDEPSVADGQAR